MRVGFVSVRFAGLDGVTLEAAKIADVVVKAGHEAVWFAGELSADFSPGVEFPPARFDSPENLALQEGCFGVDQTALGTLDMIEARATVLEAGIREFIAGYGVDVLVPQNALSIPMQLPLGVALARLARVGVPVVAHHHDFGWERDRFYPNGVDSILDSAFPPIAPAVKHVVINTVAQRELLKRTGADSTVLPNVMDFETTPDPGDGAAFRRYAGLAADDVVLLQATRIIPRKAIELTLQLAAGLNDPAVKVVVSHPAHDEGDTYADELVKLAEQLGVDLRTSAAGGPGQPSLRDAYAAADLVTYPSRIEGFGNALLEAVYYRRPLLVNRYPIYVADIAPTGLTFIECEGAITQSTIADVERLLTDPHAHEATLAANYEICRENFSYGVVRERFLPLLDS